MASSSFARCGRSRSSGSTSGGVVTRDPATPAQRTRWVQVADPPVPGVACGPTMSAFDVEHTTALAVEEKSALVKALRRFDMVFFTICAFVGLDTLGTVAANGAQGFTWLVVLALIFVVPYALVMAELGSAFTQEGGPYEWVKLAYGRLHGAIAAVLYWVTNPLWVGGSLAFIATQAWSDNIFTIHAGSVGDYVFKLLFVWFSIGVLISSLPRGKWIPNAGAIMRIIVMGFFTLTVVVYAFDHGVHGFPVSSLKP